MRQHWIKSDGKKISIVFKEKNDDISSKDLLDVLDEMSDGYAFVNPGKESIYISYGSSTKISCPDCFTYYQNHFQLADQSITYTNDLQKAVKYLINQDSNYASMLQFSPKKGWEFSKIFPHPLCQRCCSNYKCTTYLTVENAQSDLSSFREYDVQQLKSELDQIPIGAFSLFEDIELYQFDKVYVCRLSINLLDKKDYGIGRGFTKQEAIMVAILESLERLSLSGKFVEFDQVVCASYHQLKNAVHPKEVLKETNHASFQETGLMRWFPATSLNSDKSVLVSSQLIMFETDDELKRRNEQRFFSCTSNGTAIGGNETEALFFAIVEYLERSNGLKAWHERDHLTKWKKDFFKDHSRILYLFRFFKEEGVQIDIINTQSYDYLPSTVWLHIGWDEKCLNCLGSGLSPEEAVYNGLMEAFTAYKNFKTLDEHLQQRLIELYAPETIQNMTDHVLFYLNKREQFSFLKKIPMNKESYEELSIQSQIAFRKGLTSTLHNIFSNLNKEIIGVNVTPNYLKRSNKPLSVVRVLIKDAYYFNFGANNHSGDPHPFL